MSKLEDELALRNLMARYVDAVHRRDKDDWAGTWAVDALMAPFSIGTEDAVHDLVRHHGDVVEVARRPGTARFTTIADWLYTDVRGWILVCDLEFSRNHNGQSFTFHG